jgi:hypothetical protein
MRTLHGHLAVWALASAWLTSAGLVAAEGFKITNHTKYAWVDELVRVPCAAPFDGKSLAVSSGGKPVPHQVEVLSGTLEQVQRGHVWVCVSLEPGQSATYEIGKLGPVPEAQPKVTVSEDKAGSVLENGKIGVHWSEAEGLRFRWQGGPWLGGLSYQGAPDQPVKISAEITARGPLFAELRISAASAQGKGIFNVRLYPNQPCAHVFEAHEFGPGVTGRFDLAQGWKPNQGLLRRWQTGPFQGAPEVETFELKPGFTRMGETIIQLQPRWTQGFDEGYFFAATDGEHVAGIVPARPSQWYWPHENLPRASVNETGHAAWLDLPVGSGSRFWLLLAGPRELADAPAFNGLLQKIAFFPPDKLTHAYDLNWPGIPDGGFNGTDFFNAGASNPTGGRRGAARNALKAFEKKDPPKKPKQEDPKKNNPRGELSYFYTQLDPDYYGSYWDFWSPINPNFNTDFIKPPVIRAAHLKAYPGYERIKKIVEQVLRTDMHFAVTLPGGAGQECPGYQHHGYNGWTDVLAHCKEHYGFDLSAWPQYPAAKAFELSLSQPGPTTRGFHPGGDTHPAKDGPKPVEGDVQGRSTEEFPGFGVVFRNRAGTPDETYLAFKSGPNRGHYHGDQLSIHWCAKAKKIAIDHNCSYGPRPGQEHMHNRLAVGNAEFPYANMDGHERLLGFKAGPVADVAVGQVESKRLRQVLPLPPEKWDELGPYQYFDQALTYRRTLVQVKDQDGQDYFVIQDQYWGPKLKTTYCLHVLSDQIQQHGQVVQWDNATLLCAHPKEFAFEALKWSHEKAGGEATQGARLSVEGEAVEFITVLYPGKAPVWEALPNGVKVGEDEITFAGPKGSPEILAKTDALYVLVKRKGEEVLRLQGTELDLNRSQGEIGLFVPDVGYDFGPIPDWLKAQRVKDPAWRDRSLELRWDIGGKDLLPDALK